jgi:hypothetical protein
MSRIAALVASGLLIVLAGCTNDPEPPAASDPPAASASVAPSTESATPSTESATPSAAESTSTDANACLRGRYQLARFVAVGASESYGTGEGGDVRVAFDDGKYRLTGTGKDPITLTLAGQTGRMLVDGEVEGTYETNGGQATFTVGDTSGKATVNVGDQNRSLTMDEIANVMAPRGTAVVACDVDQVLIALTAVRLEFEPI